MKRKWNFCLLFAIATLATNARNNEFRKAYDEFRQQAIKEYETFRDKANQEYADFMRQAWEQYQALPEIPKPNDEPPVPPTPYPKDDKDEPIKDTPQPYEEVIPIPEPEPQPKPVEPIRDCLELRIRHRLCDWAYLLMQQTLSDAYCGANTNESVMLCAYLYCQSGYQMRLGLGNNRLYLLVASKHQIYESAYWEIDGMFYYPFNCEEQSLEICGASFPNEQPLSLLVSDTPLFVEQPSDTRGELRKFTFSSDYQEV